MRLFVFDDFRLGVLGRDGTLQDVSALVPSGLPKLDRMTALIASWPEVADAVAEAADRTGGAAIDTVTVRAPQPRPSKIVAAPVNYRAHQEEMGGQAGVYPGASIATIETYIGFCKAPSSIVGPDGAIRLPATDARVDHEAEVGIVIGPGAARAVAREEALDFVFGYVPLLDITMRGAADRSFRKSFDTFTPIGPAIVTADEVAEPAAIDFRLTVNGELRQRGSTRDLIYDLPHLVEVYSAAMTLEPGDLIASGTPEGVAELHAGDLVRLTIDGIGELTMAVEAGSVS